MELVSFPTTCDDLEFSRREKSEFGWDEKEWATPQRTERDVASLDKRDQ